MSEIPPMTSLWLTERNPALPFAVGYTRNLALEPKEFRA